MLVKMVENRGGHLQKLEDKQQGGTIKMKGVWSRLGRGCGRRRPREKKRKTG